MADSVVSEVKTLKELEKEITCSVCQEYYAEPKVLPCLHYYCKECVHRLALRTASNKPFSCPECRKETTLPEGGVEELKTAFFINRLKSNFSALERVYSKIKIFCEGCNSKSKAEAFCRHCAIFICRECAASHEFASMNSLHEIVSLEDLKQGQAKQVLMGKEKVTKCAIHREAQDIYCFDCNIVICCHCTVKVHKEHHFEFIEDSSPEMKKTLLQKMNYLKTTIKQSTTALLSIQSNKCEVQTQGKTLANSIQTSFNDLHDILERQKTKLLQEASNRVQRKMEKLLAQEKKLSQSIADAHTIMQYTEKFVSSSSDKKVMSMHAEISRQLQKEIEEHSKSRKGMKPTEEADLEVEVSCREALLQLCQTKTKITQLALDPLLCTVSGEGIKRAEVHQTAEVTLTTRLSNNKTTRRSTEVVSELKSLYNGSVIKCNVDQSGPGEYRIQYTPTVRGRHELTVSVDGQQVTGSPFPVFVSISPTQLKKPVKVWQSIKPCGITTDSDNNLIVTESNRNIVKLSIAEEKTYFYYPERKLVELVSIASDNDSNTIYGADYKSNRIVKFNTNGGNVQVYEVQQLKGPGYYVVAVVGDEVMLCERHNVGTVMVYDRELRYVRRIQHGHLGKFIGLAGDQCGNLYVPDFDDNCVHVFRSCDGVLLYNLQCDTNGVRKLTLPYGVCVSGCYVYVTNRAAHSISVFTTEGNYVTSFGQHGQKDGDFDNPRCVCTDQDGFIYVADWHNNRVQCL